MPTKKPLVATAPWTRLQSTRKDWQEADPSLLTNMLGYLHLIRAFEETVLELASEGLVYGPAHSSIGQEGGAVASIVGLTSADGVNGSHRGHHQFLAKALRHLSTTGLDVAQLVTPEIRTMLHTTLAEILGLRVGFSGGRGGSMHLQWREAGALGTNAIVGGGIPFAAGNAWAQKHSGQGAITVTYFGDGAVNIGSALETMNLAAAWKLPLCFFIENNLYAVSTHIDDVTGEPLLSARGPGFGIPSWRVDGMDPLAVHLAMVEAEAVMRSGGGPTLIEAEVYRFYHQNGSFPGSAFGYRDKDEEAQWIARDPIKRIDAEVLARKLMSQAELDSVREQARAAMAACVDELTEPDPHSATRQKRIRPDLWPSPESKDTGIRGDLSELAGARTVEPARFHGETVELKFIDAVSGVMDRRMETDERVVVMGEDIHRLKGGTNGATRGLAQKYPGRILGTPISENAFVGLAGGIAMDGRFLPVVELMYSDFLWVAADQLFNQIAKVRHMFGNTNTMPLVLRTKVAMGGGYGSQHSMDPAGIFATSAGWRIVAPTTPADYIGLMNTALALNDPVLVLEHIDLYETKGMVPAGDLDYQLPFGRAAVRREGADLTLISYLSMVGESLRAIEQVPELDVEVIDLRWLDRASLDWETIGSSIRKTNRVLIVEQGALGTSYGSWLSDEIQRRFFDWLDQPIQRVTGGLASPTISQVLDRAAIAKHEEVVDGLRSVIAEMGVR